MYQDTLDGEHRSERTKIKWNTLPTRFVLANCSNNTQAPENKLQSTAPYNLLESNNQIMANANGDSGSLRFFQ